MPIQLQTTCVHCGKPITGTTRYSFRQHGLLCDECLHIDIDAVQISRAVIQLIESLARRSHASSRRVHIPPKLAREAVSFLTYAIADSFEHDHAMMNQVLAIIHRRA